MHIINVHDSENEIIRQSYVLYEQYCVSKLSHVKSWGMLKNIRAENSPSIDLLKQKLYDQSYIFESGERRPIPIHIPLMVQCLVYGISYMCLTSLSTVLQILRVINIQRCFHLGLPPVFGGVRVAHLFSFLCCFIFVCLRPVSCVPNVASVSGFSFRNCPFVFFYVYFNDPMML